MPPEETITSQDTGTDLPVQTPAAETGTDQERASGASDAPPVEEKTVPVSKFNASRTEALRQREENQRLAAQNALMQQQIAQLNQYYQQSQQPRPAAPPPEQDKSLYGEFSDAVLDRKPEVIQKVLSQVEERAEMRVLGKLQQAGVVNQRIQMATNAIQTQLKDMDPALTNEIWIQYNKLASDPYVNATTIDDRIPAGNAVINPHIMLRAIAETRAGATGKAKQALTQAREDADYHTEPSSSRTDNSTKKFDPQKHLSDNERRIVEKTGMTPIRYWTNLEKSHPGMQAARLKAGKPVAVKDLE